MAKVVAKWKGWESCKGPFWNGNHNAFQCQQEPYTIVPDPRESTDAALDLLHWVADYIIDAVEDGLGVVQLQRENGVWHVWNYWSGNEYGDIPISGQPFRTAVCWLAVDVLGVANA